MQNNYNGNGFTLLELLAVIVILAIILAIAIPSITSLINSSKKNTFESNSKMIFSSLRLKALEDNNFDPTTINETNIKSILNIDDSNIKKLSISRVGEEIYIVLTGENNWKNFSVSGTFNNLLVTEGLVLYLDASNEDSYSGSGTTWNDLSGNGNNGTLTNGVGYDVNNGGSLVFDGINDYISFNNLNSISNWSVSIVLSTNIYSSGTVYYPFSFSTTNQYSGGIGMGGSYNSNGGNTIYIYDGITSLVKNYPLTIGKLMNIVATKNGNTYSLYVNGSFIDFQEKNNQALNTIRLGMRTDGVWPFNGKIANFQVYNRVLSETEIEENYNLHRLRYLL